MKKLVALLAIGAIGFGVTAPAFGQTKATSDTTTVRKTRKKPVKKKPKDTTTVRL